MDLIERVQYKADLIVSECWQGTSRTKLYDKLGWELLSDRRWVRRLTLFYKIINGFATSYLSPHIPTRNEIGTTLRNNVYNFVPNGLVIDDTISYLRTSGRVVKLDAFVIVHLSLRHAYPRF